MAFLLNICVNTCLLFSLLFLLVIPVSHSFLEEENEVEGSSTLLHSPKQFEELKKQCATKNITVDPNILEEVRTCLAPILEDAEKSGMSMDMSKVLPTICKHADAAKKCYKILTDVMEECYSEYFANEVVFKLSEILDNAQKAFCSKKMEKRVKKTLEDKMAQMTTFGCMIKHYQVILQDIMECPAANTVFNNPSIFQEHTSEQICKEVDKIEKCIVSPLDLCDQSNVVEKYVRRVFDVLISVIFRCPAHENF